MLDVSDFIAEKGGDPKKIRESQRRRYAPEEAVDEVITLYEDHRKSKYVEYVFTDVHSYGPTCSKIRRLASWHQDQRDSERNWVEEACQSDCWRDRRGS